MLVIFLDDRKHRPARPGVLYAHAVSCASYAGLAAADPGWWRLLAVAWAWLAVKWWRKAGRAWQDVGNRWTT